MRLRHLFLLMFIPVLAMGREYVDYVNNRIGNISHLLVPTFPTAHLPNSMLRMNPAHNEFVTDRMDGLPLNVPSHRQGNVLLLQPYCGVHEHVATAGNYRYDHETTTPYRYDVFLDDHGIGLTFVPAARAGLFSLNYEQPGERYVVLSTCAAGEFNHSANILSGYENYRGTKHYFYLVFDRVPSEVKNLPADGGKQRLAFHFGDKTKNVGIRYGISYISEEQARRNLEQEIKDFRTKSLIQRARQAWNQTLGKINIKGGTEDEKVVFYTALYRSHERMINISEEGKYYSGFDGKIHSDEGVPFWTDDWIWDNYLALHPLQILLNPKAEAEKLASYLRMYEHSGWIPTFPCVFGDAHCMNGNHAAVMFADALCKDIPFDVEKAAQAMKHTVLNESMIPWYRGPKTEIDDFYHKHGWYPALHPGEKETNPHVNSFEQRNAVAVSLAASYDDWAIARLYRHLGNDSEFKFFNDRAYNYRHVFNKKTNFFHPKDSAGNFIEPFDYIFSGGVGARAYYDENNAWTYNWQLQFNVADLVSLFGGNQPFIDKLDQLFVEGMRRSKWQYYAVHPDATGNVGQFVMGNEPSFHIPYLYNYVGQPWKTQKRIRMLMESWFRNDLMGICGDEDGGGMSAFYVFSAMGFYPVTPGLPIYSIGSPLFESVSMRLDNGKTFTVKARGASRENKYIQSARLNGKPWNKTWFHHNDLMNGGTLELEMGPRPCREWGTSPQAAPPSFDM